MAMNVTTYFRSACLLVLTPQCFDEFFVNYNFLNAIVMNFDLLLSYHFQYGENYIFPCLEAALSKGLGYGIIMGSVMVKVPQILKIWKARSGEGISLAGVLLDLSAITANVAYSFVLKYPFSAWGEGMFLVVQTAVIAALVLHFGGRPAGAVTFSAVYVAILGALLSGYTPMPVLTFLQSMCVPVVILGKTIQIRSNYRNGSTGQLSAATVLMLLAGSLARIFTSQKETGDALLVFTYVVAATLNAVTAAQLFYYWNADKDKKKKN